jgi:hypothetical protein
MDLLSSEQWWDVFEGFLLVECWTQLHEQFVFIVGLN